MKLVLQVEVQVAVFTHAQLVIFNTAGDVHFIPLQILEPV